MALLFAVTSVATGLAPSFRAFSLRALHRAGWRWAALSMLSPMYVAEVSPPSLRGRMGTLYQLSIVAGAS